MTIPYRMYVPRAPANPGGLVFAVILALIYLSAGFLSVGWGLMACDHPMPPALPADLQAEEACVAAELVAGVTDLPTIAGKCTGGILTIAADLLEWIFTSPAARAEYAAAAQALAPQIAAARKQGR
jgi:hypothetical protein